MSPHLLHRSAPITLLGGGSVNANHLSRVRAIAPEIVAADSGADAALAAGLSPMAVIGDFDSISPTARAAIPAERQFHVAEQDSTDFEKCLRAVSAPLILGLGFLGPRIDHALAAMNTLARYRDRRCILLGDEDLCFLCPPALDLTPAPGRWLSLFPLTAARAESEGLRWPIAEINFAPGGDIGTSNEVTGPVRLRMRSGALLVLLPVAEFEATAAALMAPGPADG